VKPPLAAWSADEDADIDWGGGPAVEKIDSQAKSLSRVVCKLWEEHARRAEAELCVQSDEEPEVEQLFAHFHVLLHLAVAQKDYAKIEVLNIMLVELQEAYSNRT
jgi:hypothetical protein